MLAANPNNQLESLQSGVLATLAFFALYHVPVSAEKVYFLLYKARGTKEEVYESLQELAATKKIFTKDGLYALKPWNDQDVQARIAEVEKRQKKVQKFLWLLALLPFIRQLSIINSLSLGASRQESDIDFFVVTYPRTLYFTRSVIFAVLRLCGLYKTKQRIKEQFCFGFYVTADQLDLKKILILPEDPYTAFWLASMQPVLGKKHYAKLVEANPWVFAYLPNFYPIWHYDRLITQPKTRWLKLVLEVLLILPALALEPWLRFAHIKHTFNLPENHWPTATTIATSNMLKLHALDPRAKIRENFYLAWRQAASS